MLESDDDEPVVMGWRHPLRDPFAVNLDSWQPCPD